MYLHLRQSPYPGIRQAMTSFLLRVSPLHTGASIILLLPEVSASGDGADKPVISLWVEVKGASILGSGTGRAKEALAFA